MYKYIDYLIINSIASIQNIEIREVQKMPTPPAPFAIDKCYGSKSSVYGTQNKIRGANE